MKTLVTFACLFAFALRAFAETPPATTEEPIPVLASSETEKIAAALGKKVTVRGQVLRSGKSKSGTNFLNFANYAFKVVTFKDALKNFPQGEPADVYKGKTIEITGVIEKYKEQYEIKLLRPDQVKVVETPKETPPAKPAEAPAKPTEKPKPEDPKETPAPAKKPDEGSKPVDPKSFFKK